MFVDHHLLTSLANWVHAARLHCALHGLTHDVSSFGQEVDARFLYCGILTVTCALFTCN